MPLPWGATFQFQLLSLLSFVAPLVCFCYSLHSKPSITWPVYYRLGVFNILKLSRNLEEEGVAAWICCWSSAASSVNNDIMWVVTLPSSVSDHSWLAKYCTRWQSGEGTSKLIRHAARQLMPAIINASLTAPLMTPSLNDWLTDRCCTTHPVPLPLTPLVDMTISSTDYITLHFLTWPK